MHLIFALRIATSGERFRMNEHNGRQASPEGGNCYVQQNVSERDYADEVEQVSEILRETMEQVVELSVPLSIDINYGRNWTEAK